MHLEAVAWVPDDDAQRNWSIAAGLAAKWVQDRCSMEGASGVLITHTMDDTHVPELQAFERANCRTSRLAKAARVGAGIGPVLSYVPDEEDLSFAMQKARKSSLGVVEGILSFPLSGWAAWFEAWDLVAEKPTPPLPETIKEAVGRLAFHGNNGFGDPFGKQQARSIIDGLAEVAPLDPKLILGATLAAGVSPRGIKNLSRLMDTFG